MLDLAGISAGSGTCLLAAPYLARLTITVPDRDNVLWWRGAVATPQRTTLTAGLGLVLGGLAGAAAGWTWALPALVWLALISTPLVIVDSEHRRLPNRLVFALAGGEVVLGILAATGGDDWAALLRGVEAAAAVFAALFAVAFLTPRSFGYGDVKLAGVLGGYMGWFGWGQVYCGVFAGFAIGALVGLALLAVRRASMDTALAFGPMLILGSLLILTGGFPPSY